MPLFAYHCEDCSAELEILHAAGQAPLTCGLSCQRSGSGVFGSGRLSPHLQAPNINLGATGNRGSEPDHSVGNEQRGALRERALRQLGDTLSEGELDKLRDRGMTVYRKETDRTWHKDGGDPSAPERIQGDDDKGGKG